MRTESLPASSPSLARTVSPLSSRGTGSLAMLALLAALGGPAALEAQAAPEPPPHEQVISANPFGLLLEFFNAEYERIISPSSTAGFGGSTYPDDNDRYVNLDVFWRFYPSGRPLDGWAFGTKVGMTNIPDEGTYFGFGFDVNRSWLLGAYDNFYVGVGFGLKRLVGAPEDVGMRFVPTIRLVNVGIAF